MSHCKTKKSIDLLKVEKACIDQAFVKNLITNDRCRSIRQSDLPLDITESGQVFCLEADLVWDQSGPAISALEVNNLIIRANHHTITITNPDGFIFNIHGSENVRLEGFNLIGQTIGNNPGSAITISSSSNVIIEDLILKELFFAPVLLDSINGLVLKNVFYTNSSYSTAFLPPIIVAQLLTNYAIFNVFLEQSAISIDGVNGFVHNINVNQQITTDSPNLVVTGVNLVDIFNLTMSKVNINIVQDAVVNTLAGLFVTGIIGSSSVTDLNINIVQTALVENSGGVVIQSGQNSKFSEMNILFSEQNNNSVGLVIIDSITGSRFQDNNIQNAGIGIFFDNSQGNSFLNNKIHNASGSPTIGIAVINSATSNEINFNTITGTVVAITGSLPGGSPSSGNLVYQNRIFGNQQAFSDMAQNELRDNIVFNNPAALSTPSDKKNANVDDANVDDANTKAKDANSKANDTNVNNANSKANDINVNNAKEIKLLDFSTALEFLKAVRTKTTKKSKNVPK